MRFVVLGVMLAFSTPASDARADDDPSELARQVEECLGQHRDGYHGACAKEIRACTERNILEGNRVYQLKKGMTYDEALNVMGRQPDFVKSTTYAGTAMEIYEWDLFKKMQSVSAIFIDGRLSKRGVTNFDTFDPQRPPGLLCG